MKDFNHVKEIRQWFEQDLAEGRIEDGTTFLDYIDLLAPIYTGDNPPPEEVEMPIETPTRTRPRTRTKVRVRDRPRVGPAHHGHHGSNGSNDHINSIVPLSDELMKRIEDASYEDIRTGCWIHDTRMRNGNCTMINIGGKPVTLRRLMFAHWTGQKLNNTMIISNSCGDAKCWREDHLYLKSGRPG